MQAPETVSCYHQLLSAEAVLLANARALASAYLEVMHAHATISIMSYYTSLPILTIIAVTSTQLKWSAFTRYTCQWRCAMAQGLYSDCKAQSGRGIRTCMPPRLT